MRSFMKLAMLLTIAAQPVMSLLSKNIQERVHEELVSKNQGGSRSEYAQRIYGSLKQLHESSSDGYASFLELSHGAGFIDMIKSAMGVSDVEQCIMCEYLLEVADQRIKSLPRWTNNFISSTSLGGEQQGNWRDFVAVLETSERGMPGDGKGEVYHSKGKKTFMPEGGFGGFKSRDSPSFQEDSIDSIEGSHVFKRAKTVVSTNEDKKFDFGGLLGGALGKFMPPPPPPPPPPTEAAPAPPAEDPNSPADDASDPNAVDPNSVDPNAAATDAAEEEEAEPTKLADPPTPPPKFTFGPNGDYPGFRRPVKGKVTSLDFAYLDDLEAKDSEFNQMFNDMMDTLDNICINLPEKYKKNCHFPYLNGLTLVEMYLHDYDDWEICVAIKSCTDSIFLNP